MAESAKYAITTFQRKPGLWRAAIIRADQHTSRSSKEDVLSIVTPLDCPSEDAAGQVAAALVKKL
jgi:hypothetical protein